MGVMAGANTAAADKDVATAELNRELQDKGFLPVSYTHLTLPTKLLV